FFAQKSRVISYSWAVNRCNGASVQTCACTPEAVKQRHPTRHQLTIRSISFKTFIIQSYDRTAIAVRQPKKLLRQVSIVLFHKRFKTQKREGYRKQLQIVLPFSV